MSDQDTAGPGAARGRFRIDGHSQPYTHLEFRNDPEAFQFALVSDNSGGGRAGVLHAAARLLNELQPEFVVNLGDLVEGYNDPGGFPATEQTYRTWWREIDAALAPLEMPFFYVPGNHDLNNPASVQVWRERLGGTRDYYHFRYRDVLFLVVNTEDPPKDTDHVIEHDPEQAAVLEASYHAVKDAVAAGADVETVLEAAQPIEDFFGVINISETQVDYFAGVLAATADVRWTFVLMHAPAWSTSDGLQRDPRNFARIEQLLADRPYTVFAAHTHKYNYTERHGRDYIITAMTGAMNVPRLGAIDHVVWVTMTNAGPKIANLLLNGILDKHGPTEGDPTTELGMYRPPPPAPPTR